MDGTYLGFPVEGAAPALRVERPPMERPSPDGTGRPEPTLDGQERPEPTPRGERRDDRTEVP